MDFEDLKDVLKEKYLIWFKKPEKITYYNLFWKHGYITRYKARWEDPNWLENMIIDKDLYYKDK